MEHTDGQADKVKVNLFPTLISYATHHEDVWESGGISSPSLTSALDEIRVKKT
jgi:hypothetical protein